MSQETVELALAEPLSPLTLCIHGEQDQHVSKTLRETAVWEPFESHLILERLQRGATFVDVGANIGYFSVLAAQQVGAAGQVFAFEPDPANVALLRQSIALNELRNCDVIEAGLSSTDQKAQLFLSENNFGDHQIYAHGNARQSVDIELLNGTSYLRPRLSRLDFLKVDVQGAEIEVMAGLMPLLLELNAYPDVLIELTPYSLVQAGGSGRQLIELLARLNLPFWIVDHIEHDLVASTAEELAVWCDNVESCGDDQGFMNIMLSKNG
ncbi:MAG: FkbM family methyltransferase [Pseudomonadales bacterium]